MTKLPLPKSYNRPREQYSKKISLSTIKFIHHPFVVIESGNLCRQNKGVSAKIRDPFMTRLPLSFHIIVHRSSSGTRFHFPIKVSLHPLVVIRSRVIYVAQKMVLQPKRGDPFMTRLSLSNSYNRQWSSTITRFNLPRKVSSLSIGRNRSREFMWTK